MTHSLEDGSFRAHLPAVFERARPCGVTLSPHLGALTPVWVVPLSAPRLIPGPPLSCRLRSRRLRGLRGTRGISPPDAPLSALPRRVPRAGLSCGHFGGNQLSTALDWSFAPIPGSWIPICTSGSLRPSTTVSRGFGLPRDRSCGFWFHRRDLRQSYHRAPGAARALRAFGFPAPPGF